MKRLTRRGVTAVLLMQFAAISGALAQDVGTIFLRDGGSLNAQPVDASHYWIQVDQGQRITGTIKIETNNLMQGGAVAPLGYTATWGDRVAQPVLTNGWIGTGVQQYDVAVDKYAPSALGDYYLLVAFAGRYDIAQVMSNTTAGQPALWYDGNDLGWDWNASQYQQARDSGKAAVMVYMPSAPGGYEPYNQAATWVGVHVTPEPATLSLLALGGLLIARRRRA